MTIPRMARVLAILGGIAAFALTPSFGQNPKNGLFVQPVRPDVIDVEPMSSVTIVFSAANLTSAAHAVAGRFDLPDGWRLVLDDAPFRLDAGEDTIRLLSFFVPMNAKAGRYRIGYAVHAADDPAVAARGETEVNVLLHAAIAVEVFDAPAMIVAGGKYQSRFMVVNRSNAPATISLMATSESGFVLVADATRIGLEAGETRLVTVLVQTDPSLRQKTDHHLRLTAEAIIAERGTLGASALARTEVIPRVYGTGDYFNKIPAEVALIGLRTDTAGQYAQFKVSGSGTLDEAGRRKVDFLLRGPGRDDFYLFSLQREEYRASYESPGLDVHVGDKMFALTRLSEYGEYGRGFEANLKKGVFSLRGYYEQDFYLKADQTETAAELGYEPSETAKFSLCYMTKNKKGSSAGRLFSLQSQLMFGKSVNVNLEYSWDGANAGLFRKANSAFWLESTGRFPKMSYQFTAIRSGASYQGYYRNLDYTWAEVASTPVQNIQLRALYMDQKRNTPIPSFYPAFFDRTLEVGARFQLFRWLNVSAERRMHDREDLSPDAEFNYRDSTWRLGSFLFLGTFSLQNYVDLGTTVNSLTGASEKLREFTLSANYLLLHTISLGSCLHYRDQDQSFTGDHERRLDLNLNLGFQFGRTTMDAFYRTALHQEFYRIVLSEEILRDPTFLLNNYDMFGASVTHRFANGHQVTVRVQNAAHPFENVGAAKSFIGLVEYSIPVGIPVRRRTDVGMLRGRVVDAEHAGKGVEGVIIRANDLATVTNDKGEYFFHTLAPGRYFLTVGEDNAGRNKITSQKMPLDLSVEGGKRTEGEIGLVTGASLAGRVMVYKFEKPEATPFTKVPADAGPTEKTEPDSSKPKLVESAGLGYAVVEVTNGVDTYRQMTDGEGKFEFESLRPGRYTLRAFGNTLPELHQFEQDTFDVMLTPGGQEHVAIRVVPIVRPIQIIDQGEIKAKVIKKSEKE